MDSHPSASSNPPRTPPPLPQPQPPAPPASCGNDISLQGTTANTSPSPSSSRLNTQNIPPQFWAGNDGGGGGSSTASPHGVFASNYSLKSELERIRLEDHCFVHGQKKSDQDDYPDPDNINLSSLMSRMRRIRSSGQIQYRIPKKRRREDEPKGKDGDSDELETVTILRQKRVKKSPRGPKSEKDKAWEQKTVKRGWLLRPACHPPMVLDTVPECHPPMVLDDSQSTAAAAEEEEEEGSEMKLVE